MYWDKVAKFYDLFEGIANKKVYEETGVRVADEIESGDDVLECACGTGAISKYIAPKCRYLTATDFSDKMLRQTDKKLRSFANVYIEKADITKLAYANESFDKVVAGNVIHLMDDPYAVLEELMRVCRPGGKVIIPTYINKTGGRHGFMVKLLEKSGAGFKRQFDMESYRAFFENAGYTDVKYDVVDGRMPCAIAIIDRGLNI